MAASGVEDGRSVPGTREIWSWSDSFMFPHLSDYEAGSPALPCDPSPPSPVALSLHRAFLQVWPPTRLIGPLPCSVRKGWALESVAARSAVREAVVSQPTCWCVIPGAVADGRRLQVVVDGLPLFGGAQLAVDPTLD